MSYTTSKAQAAILIVLSIGPVTGTSSPTFVPIFELSAAPIDGQTWEKEETSNFNSGITKEYLKTMLDSGTMELQGNRVSSDAGQTALRAAFLDPALSYMFTLSYPKAAGQTTSGDMEAFSALVMSMNTEITTGKVIKIKTTLQRTGPVTLTEGS